MTGEAYSPLLRALDAHRAKGRASFHMPAHKGAAECLSPLGEILRLDLTELPDTGSLFDGEGATAEAERAAARFFGTAGTFMSAGGCTLAIEAMLRLLFPRGGRLLCSRVIHRSAVNAMALLGITPVWLAPDSSAGVGFVGRVRPSDVSKALELYSDIGAVYLTVPDYFGVMSDVGAVVAAARTRGVPVIADSAHGAHLRFLGGGLSALERGAAVSADSAHKTLPVLTGGAWLNAADERYLPGAREALSLFGSTSPSYPIMLSLDLCRVWLENGGCDTLRALVPRVAEVKEYVKSLGFTVPDGECDPLRLAIAADGMKISPREAGELLRENGAEPEYAGESGLILIPSPFNTADDFAVLRAALGRLAEAAKPIKSMEPCKAERLYEQPEVVVSPREAMLSESCEIDTAKAVGRVAASAACPCPPGIPAVVPGEIITPLAKKMLDEYKIFRIKVVK